MRTPSSVLALTIVGFFPFAACSSNDSGGSGSFTADDGGSSSIPSGSSSSGAGAASSGSGRSSSGSGGSTGTTSGSSSGGSSGSSGGGSDAGASSGADTGATAANDSWLSAPTPANASGQYPFPQDRRSPGCSYPATISHAQIESAYQAWLATLVTTMGAGSNERVQDPMSSNDTTSEGIGYGMLITVYMADQNHFDKLWGFAQAHVSRGLMSWQIDSSGNPIGGGGENSATDADEDIAWALLMADKQWPGGSYLSQAKSLIGSIRSSEVGSSKMVTDGNFNNAGSSHPDYAAPDYYKVFATVSGDSSWNDIYDAEYSFLASSQDATTGLIPDAVNSGSFGFDACRAPWRVGLDYCWNGSPKAQAFLSKINGYFMQTSNSGAMPQNIKIPVATTGGTGMYASGAITGPSAIAAMSSASNQTLVDNSWKYLNTIVTGATGGGASENYFSASVGLISMLALSGNFIDFTNLPK